MSGNTRIERKFVRYSHAKLCRRNLPEWRLQYSVVKNKYIFLFLLLSLKSRLPLQDLDIIHRIQWGIIQEKETKSKYGLGNDSRQE